MSDTITSTAVQNGSSNRERNARRVIGLLWLLVLLEYGVLFYFMIVVPMAPQMANGISIDKALNWTGATYFGLFCLMVVFGAQRMRSALKMPDQLAAKQWTAGAAVLALPSLYGYLLLIYKLRVLWMDLNDQRLPGYSFTLFTIALVVLGFYVPFIFLTCWLNYRHRTDEF